MSDPTIHHHGHMPKTDVADDDNMGHHMMAMYFHGGFNEVILFDFWRINSLAGLIGSMIACFILAVGYEAIKFSREVVFRKYNAPFIDDGGNNPSNGRLDEDNPSRPTIRRALVFKDSIGSKSHLILTCLHITQVLVSYLLMLIFMTYNSWLCLSVILGAGSGYFFFGWKRSSVLDVSDHCH